MSLTANIIFLLLVIICIYNRCLYLNQKSINKIQQLQIDDSKKRYNDLFYLHRSHIHNTDKAIQSCAEVVRYYRLLEETRKDKEEQEHAEEENSQE